MNLIEVAKTTEPEGAMKHVETGNKEICMVNDSCTFSVIGDRCPHIYTRLFLGTFPGGILTWPYHFSRFKIKTGKTISGPVMPKLGGIDKTPPPGTVFMKRVAKADNADKNREDLHVCPVKIGGTGVLVDIG